MNDTTTDSKVIVVDLDDTLIRTDSLVESLLFLLKKNLFSIVFLLINLLKGKLHFKSYVCDNCDYSSFSRYFPVNNKLADFLKLEKSLGSKIVLVTASLDVAAKQIINELGLSSLFDEIHGSSDKLNLKGEKKLNFIISTYKDAHIIYCGDSSSDLIIWESDKIDGAVITGRNSRKLVKHFNEALKGKILKIIDLPKITCKDYLKALRVHQWSKNCLIFVPLLCSFSFLDLTHDFLCLFAFISFSLGASATYILNDLWDLPSDRIHFSKCKRPFAAGLISVSNGIVLSVVLLLMSVGISFLVSLNYFFLQLFYLLFTTLYSVILKRIVLIDIVALAILYVTRILAGNIVANIELSYWLISFAFMVFLSLGALKRYVELCKKSDVFKKGNTEDLTSSRCKDNQYHKVSGRGYVVNDIDILLPLGISTYIGAIVLFGLYITSSDMVRAYSTPELLWVIQMLFFCLIGNMWFTAKRGQMLDDPVLYFMKDKTSLLSIIAISILASVAYYL